MTGPRIAGLRASMRENSLDAFLVTSLAAVRYLTGFSGSNALAVVTARRAFFVSDSRYRLQSGAEVRGFRRIIGRRGLLEDAAASQTLRACRTAGFESDTMTYAQYRSLRRLFPGVAFRPATGIVESLSLVKDPGEIACIEQAAAIADRVFSEVLASIRPGVTELDVASEISYLNRRRGGESDAFDVIVASGPRGALPHARPTARKLRKGEFVLLDFGSRVRGYNSDLTRTVALGRVPRRLREAYSAVLEANEAASAAARAGMTARALDAVARTCLRRRGFGRYFVHSLGHGLGLRVHERPHVSPLSREVLERGSVITIEPGVYIPGAGGVRIEDDLLLGRSGCRLLTRSRRDLIVL
ncbi:MAG TPA: Xaa-Pro peptidase family protein [Bacteroidota bacterium]|nr:Xaa-Pro peptidase family protein [Bacteroidota bacterium]